MREDRVKDIWTGIAARNVEKKNYKRTEGAL
jgi:hypothetical protein